jgi:hypothetical protein
MLDFKKIFGYLNPKARRAEQANAELRANAEKALRMKQEADTGSPHPAAPHRPRGHAAKEPNEDHIPAREGYFTPELKRTKVARSGDTGNPGQH